MPRSGALTRSGRSSLQLFVLSADVAENSAHGRRIEGHDFYWKRNQLVVSGRNPAQIEILENRRVAGEEHVMHRKSFAPAIVHRWAIDSYQRESAPEQSADATFREHGPLIGERGCCDRAARLEQEPLDVVIGRELIEHIDRDNSIETAHVDNCRAPDERFERELVAAGCAVANVKRSVGVSSYVRAGVDRRNVYAGAA